MFETIAKDQKAILLLYDTKTFEINERTQYNIFSPWWKTIHVKIQIKSFFFYQKLKKIRVIIE